MTQLGRSTAALAALMALTSAALARPVRAQAPSARLAPDTSWVTRSALYEVNVRDFSAAGDLRGVTAGLKRIEATGADVIWLMPIFPVGVLNAKGPLGSPYAVRDFDAINPAFGTAADLRALVRAAHARRMKVILDWVPDHTSWDNGWIREHPEYYVHDDSGRIVVPRDLQGHPTDWTDVAQLDYRNAGLRTAMIASLRRWLVDFDLDGYRMDVAHFIPPDFWAECDTALRAAVRRPIMLLAEAGELAVHRVGFDLSYGWDGYARLKAVWKGAPVDSFVLGVLADQQAMPRGGMRMRFTTNHDETAWDNPPVTLFGGPAGARAAFVAMALMPGRPLLYDGQEVESPEKLGLFEREAINWSQPDSAQALGLYAHVIYLARTDPAFLRGDLRRVVTSDSTDVIAYRRGAAVVLVNARRNATRFTVTGFAVDGARDVLTNHVERGDTLALPAYGAVVLER
ncbi:MAG TPA: alpha-amylase family glycosyl hydrolase [Gemmatimonadales bacterium]|nr:alpha-amylase family glycosyl hydrolase [Gemmatimonadales bacterium]